jgi:Rieske Fe-S protein
MADSGEGHPQSRRSFLNILIGGGVFLWLGSVLYPVTKYLIPPKSAGADVSSVEAAGLNELTPNSYKMFRFGTKPGILIRQRDGNFKALSARCTHLDCTVQYKEDTGQIWCACHNGIYDLEGRNVSGPPPRPLERYEVVIKDEKVFVRRGESS